MVQRTLNDDILNEIGEEFADRVRRGENPTISEYTTGYSPEDARDVADFLDSIAMLENAKQPAASHPVSAPEGLPEQFGRYRIERTLGEGGMGAVYLAHDSQLDRKVALKTPKFSGDADPTMMKRFYREARSAATLQHPNICPVYDVGEIDGIHYISMAFIEGRPLSDLVRAKKQPPVASILRVVRKVAIALHEAHSQGLIHRDLKPANIMIDRRNEPIVMDFGLARQFGDETPESTTTPARVETKPETAKSETGKVEARLTMDGTVMGSPGYMAPEQLRGQHSKIGPASDVYALGVLLYELLTGRLPFPGTGSLMSIVNSVISDPPPDATTVRSGIDPQVAAICRKAMAKKIDDRYESMQSFAVALTKVLKTDSDDGRTAVTGIVSPSSSPELVRVKEQYELARSLYQDKQYAAAASIMEKMVSAEGPSSQYTEWAKKKLPQAQEKAEQGGSTGPLHEEELWDFDQSEFTLPPRTSGTKSRRRKKTGSRVRTFLLGAAGAVAVLTVALVLRNIKRSTAADNGSPAVVSATSESNDDINMSGRTDEQVADESDAAADSKSSPGTEASKPDRPFRPLTPAELRNMTPQQRIARVDTNQDGKLSMEELKATPRIAQNGIFGRIMENFKEFDQNADGELDQFEQGRIAGLFSQRMQGKLPPPGLRGKRPENRRPPRDSQ